MASIIEDITEKVKSLRGVARPKGREPIVKHQFVLSEAKGLIVLPDADDPREISATYDLISPYARAQINWSEVDQSLVYRVSEPSLDEEEEKAYQDIVDSLIELVDVQLSTIKDQRAAIDYIEEHVHDIMDQLSIRLDKSSYNKVMYYIYRNFVGLNEIEPLLHDPYIEDIGCVGYYTPLYVVHKKYGSLPTNIAYEDEEELKDFVIKLAERCGRYISYAEPLLDGTLPDGSRVQASLAEDVTTKGPTFSLRKFTEEPLSPVEIMELETASPEVMAYLWLMMEYGSSALICGGTASGKTTLLNAISMFIPPEDKVVSIEDTRELQLPHKNWIPAVARLGFGAPGEGGERYGEVDMFDLLKESFRQNPDYVIVGEIRGEEAYVMFQGMASGHPSLGTMHAAGVQTVIKRLMSPPIELSPSLVEILDLIVTMVFAQEKGKSSRRIKNVTEIQSVTEKGSARTGNVFRWIPTSDTFERGESNYILERLARRKGYEMSDIRQELDAREAVMKWMLDNNVTHWKEVANIVENYHQDPNATLEELGLDIRSPLGKQLATKTTAREGVREDDDEILPPPEPDIEAEAEQPPADTGREEAREPPQPEEPGIPEPDIPGEEEGYEIPEVERAEVDEEGADLSVLEGTVDEVKEELDESWDLQAVLEAEKKGKDRKTVKRYIRSLMEEEMDLSFLEGTVEDAKEAVRSMDNPDYEVIMEAERDGKDRKTLKRWLDEQME